MGNILSLNQLQIGYAASPIGQPLSHNFVRGVHIGIIGDNGSGKSTLAKTLLGLVKPLAGNFTWLKGLRLSYVPQESSVNLYFPLRVMDCIKMGNFRSPKNLWAKSNYATIMDELGLADLQHALVRELSGGQRQRVLIARALMSSPDVIFFDEAWNSLDQLYQLKLEALIGSLQEQLHITCFFVEHDLKRLKSMVHEIIQLSSEQITMMSVDIL